MTALRQRAFVLLAGIREEELEALIQYMENMEKGQSFPVPGFVEADKLSKKQAYQNLKKYFGRITETVDYKNELEEALWGKYESIG